MMDLIEIDGSEGEGGGQILRTSLSLSMVTGRPFRMTRIRARRERPGLQRQHLTAAKAAQAISGASMTGAELGSMALEFRPGAVSPGDYQFSVGTAGSATLVLETLLPPLLTASGPSTLRLKGGTHNPLAPPFEFLARSFAPQIERMGPSLQMTLIRRGFYPAGGGELRAQIGPVKRLSRLDISDRGPIRRRSALALVAGAGASAAQPVLRVVRERLGWLENECEVEVAGGSEKTGNALLLEIEAERITAVFSGFGERGNLTERVAHEVADAALGWLATDAPVDENLADQLLIPLALARAGAFRTVRPTAHARTNAATIQRFLDVTLCFERDTDAAWWVRVAEG